MTFVEWINEVYGSSMLPADEYDRLESCYSYGYRQGQADQLYKEDSKNKVIKIETKRTVQDINRFVESNKIKPEDIINIYEPERNYDYKIIYWGTKNDGN